MCGKADGIVRVDIGKKNQKKRPWDALDLVSATIYNQHGRLGMIGCSEESSIPDEQPGESEGAAWVPDDALDRIHWTKLAGWKFGIKDDVTGWVVRRAGFFGCTGLTASMIS